MTIIQKIRNFYKRNNNFLSLLDTKVLKAQKFNSLILITFIIVFSVVFFISSNSIDKKNKDNEKNFKEMAKTSEFSNLTNFLLSKINSPYEEINYIIKNNDSIEKILRDFKVRDVDVKIISDKLKQKKLINIYSGRKLNLIIKKLENGSNTLVNLV